jgi:hypothetical protein
MRASRTAQAEAHRRLGPDHQHHGGFTAAFPLRVHSVPFHISIFIHVNRHSFIHSASRAAAGARIIHQRSRISIDPTPSKRQTSK